MSKDRAWRLRYYREVAQARGEAAAQRLIQDVKSEAARRKKAA
jgi:hypothetical protein